ncbi:MAG: hypothetical protein GTO63_29845, partial [Anaerolineae bacterium]|nr:hypothetical protein [Anaerolineae bacterium]NIN98483.1 hypothetical protein [Anaerolineae bacterium]NIQ81827.1 hypothetical protein [Anaerolineae bacterium]
MKEGREWRCFMNAMKCRKVVATWLAVILISSTLMSCGTLEVGIERTPLRYTQDTATPEGATAPKEVLVTRDKDALVLQPVH